MRVMVMVKATKNSESGVMPSEKLLADMGKFNEELVKAGIMLAGEGLHPSSKGARVKFGRGKPVVIDGPFTETKEILGGFWMINVKSLAEAVEWARQAPCPEGEMIEIRQVYEAEDFGPDVAERERELIRQQSMKKRT